MEYQYYTSEWHSPLGSITLVASNIALETIVFTNDLKWQKNAAQNEFINSVNPVLEEAINQLGEYFNGIRKEFDLPLNLMRTNFQKEVWNTIQQTNYAQTITYTELASMLGGKEKVRAVAKANSTNQLLIVVPCHRIIGENHKLVGYRGGLERKRWLINFEKQNMPMESKTTLF